MKPEEGGKGRDRHVLPPQPYEALVDRGLNCPSLEDWGMYSAGALPEGKAAELLAHAGDCAACAGLLVDMIEETPDEMSVPALKSATPEWKKSMALRLEATRTYASRQRRPSPFRWVLAVAAMLAVGVITVTSSPVLLWGIEQFSGRQLVYRAAGAGYAPRNAQRGPSDEPGPAFNLIKLLIAARDVFGRESASALRIHGRIGFHEQFSAGRIKTTVESLTAAHALSPNDSGIANDLAVALLWRADSDGRFLQKRVKGEGVPSPELGQGSVEDVMRAIEVLKNALIIHKNDPSLLFNLALAQEQGMFYTEALSTWNEFQLTNSAAGWVSEMKESIERIQERQQARNTAHSGGDYLVFGLAATGFKPANYNIEMVADEMSAAPHSDRWLRDFLAKSQTIRSQQGIKLLHDASQLKSADKERALRQALSTFENEGNEPASDFAAYTLAEAIQSGKEKEKSEECVALLRLRLPEVVGRNYRWLEVEMDRVLGLCQGKLERFGLSYEALIAGNSAAKAAQYDTLQLRSLSSMSSYFRQIGAYRDALPVDAEVLSIYWTGVGEDFSAYQSYYGLATALSKLQYPQAAVSIMNEAVRLVPRAYKSGSKVEASVRAQYSEMLADAGRDAEAKDQLDRSEEIFNRVEKPGEHSDEYQYARLSRARFEGRRGNAGKWVAETAGMVSGLGASTNPAFKTRFWSVRAELLAEAGDLSGSKDALNVLLGLGRTVGYTATEKVNSGPIPFEAVQAAAHLADMYKRNEPQTGWQIWTAGNRLFSNSTPQPNVARLVYAALPSGPTVFVEKADRITAIPLDAPADIAQSIRTFQALVSTPGSSMARIRSLAATLYLVLIQPVRAELKDMRVVDIAASEPYSGVPFAALMTPEGEWFADQYQIVYRLGGGRDDQSAIDLTTGMRLLSVDYSQRSEVLGSSFPALTSLSAEVDEAERTFPDDPMIKSGSQATLANVIGGFMGRNVFQFSGHAFTVANDAGLILAPGANSRDERVLWASSLSAGLLKDVRIAVLAACSTGKPRTEGQYPGSNMAHAFLLAGVPLVVASSWDVDSRSTGELVRRFYSNLQSHLSPESAVAESSAALRKQSAFAHPYYWAAFSLFRS